LFAIGVVYTGGKLPPASLTTVANLLPVSLTPVASLPPVSTALAKLVAKFAPGVVFVANLPPVFDIGGAPSPANISANFQKNSKRS
jgi:hypothetical protein